MSTFGDFCCTPDSGDCCGPGSWCCARAGKHSHEEEHLAATLDDAVKAAMQGSGCERVTTRVTPICRHHGGAYDAECSTIGYAVRAGWAAAIDADEVRTVRVTDPTEGGQP